MKAASLIRTAFIAGTSLISVGIAQAADVSGIGIYATISADPTQLPDGSTFIRIHQRGVLLDDDTSSPFHLSAQDCQGTLIIGADGSATGVGQCDAVDKDGDRWWISWIDEGGGGSRYTITHGTGKFAGATGGGTTSVMLNMPDRMALTYQGSVDLK